MKKIVKNLKQHSVEERQFVTLVATLCITGFIGMIWLSSTFGGGNFTHISLDKNAEQSAGVSNADVTPFSSFKNEIGSLLSEGSEKFSQLGNVFKDMFSREQD